MQLGFAVVSCSAACAGFRCAGGLQRVYVCYSKSRRIGDCSFGGFSSMMLADDDVARALHMLIGRCVSGFVHTILWQGTAACMHSNCFLCVILCEFSFGWCFAGLVC
jgi:hypothetical protein